MTTIADFYVLEYGKDCDGSETRGTITNFHHTEHKDAKEFYRECCESSDGMQYVLTKDLNEVRRYCDIYDMDFIHAITLRN